MDPTTGSITPIVSGLDGSSGVDVRGGQVYFTTSFLPESGEAQPATSLQRTTPSGKQVKPAADLLAYERDNNPDGQPLGVQTPTRTRTRCLPFRAARWSRMRRATTSSRSGPTAAFVP